MVCMHISNKYRFVKNKPMQTFRETVSFRKVLFFRKHAYHFRKVVNKCALPRKRLPLEGKLSPIGD